MSTIDPTIPLHPMRRTIRVTAGFFYFSILLLIVGIGVLIGQNHATNKSNGLQAVGILACTWGGVGLVVCPWLIWMYRRAARRADKILSGAGQLAQWTCSPDEWERHILVIAQRGRKSRRIVLIILGISAVIAGGSALAGLMSGNDPVKPALVILVLAIIAGTLSLIYFLWWIAAVYLPVRLLQRPSSRDVFIGAGGVVSAGRFTSWEMMGASIQAVRYEPADPGTLVFQWSQPGGGYDGMPMTMEAVVPVPQSHDADAHRVIEYFKNQFKPPAGSTRLDI